MATSNIKRGSGLVNYLINKLDKKELHLPGYSWCGPGTDVEKRLAKGDQGINPLDRACKDHDLFYTRHQDTQSRHIADRRLADAAWERVKAKDANWKEKAAAWFVTNAMKSKVKFGLGLPFSQVVKAARLPPKYVKGKKRKPLSLQQLSQLSVARAKSFLKKNRNRAIRKPRVLPLPKQWSGGMLPLIPIFAGLSAIGSLLGGASSVVRAVRETSNNGQKQQHQRSNGGSQTSSTKIGEGIFLKPYRKGYGIYLKPYKQY